MKNINWLDHFANLFVVILGISIAFYLEGYKETDNNRALERKYIESLVTDLEQDISHLDTLLQRNEGVVEALITLSNASVGRPYGSDTALMNYTFAIQYNPPFTSQRTSYESMKSSGRMDLIGSFEIRNQVVDLYEQYYRGTNEFDEAINEHLRDFIKPFFMENLRFVSATSISPDFLPKNDFRNMIFAYRHLFIAKNVFYKKVRDRAEVVKINLENYLDTI